MLNQAFEEGARDWLETTGELAHYRSKTTGVSIQTPVTLERDVTTVDDMGMTTSGMVVSLLSTAVAKPVRGDTISFQDGAVVEVDELLDESGYLIRLLVSKV